MHGSTRRLLAALAVTATSAAAAGPAAAEERVARSLVHQVPKLPLVVDGVRYAPKQIHRFDGQPLYMRLTDDGKKLIAFTKISDYRRDLHKLGLGLPMDPGPAKANARASGSGHWLDVCTGPSLTGDCKTIDSGKGIANFGSVNGCDWFGHCWNFVNTISSVETYGQYALLFDAPDFNRGGMSGFYNSNILTVAPNTVLSLSYAGFDNKTESAFMFW
jgi:hypothetical protein